MDKPAGVGAEARDPAELDAPADLGERLARWYGEPAPRLVYPMPRRASGITLLGYGAADARAACPVEALTVVVGVRGFDGPERGRLRSGAGHEAAYRVVQRVSERALVAFELVDLRERRWLAGLLEQLARRGCSVVGDYEHGGLAATRLFVHVAATRGRARVSAPLPSDLLSWVSGAVAPPSADVAAPLERAGLARWGMQRASEVVRLLDAGNGELGGVVVERYGEHAVLSLSTPEAVAARDALAQALVARGARGVYLKQRVRADLRRRSPEELAPSSPIAGEPAPGELVVRHGDLRFAVRLADGLSTGLFLDQHASWRRVAAAIAGKSLLNLFCYTGAFTVAAAAAGARETLSVDLSGRALERAQRNLELNGVRTERHRLLKADVLAWLPRAIAAGERFDCIVLDPPSFGTRSRGVLDAARDYPSLVEQALALLAPSGRLLCVSHHRRHDGDALVQLVRKAARRARREVKVRPLVGPWDCPTLPGVSETKSVLVQSA